MQWGNRGHLARGLEQGTRANIPPLRNLGASSFPTTFVRREAGKTGGINSILYEGYGNVLFNIIVISYLVLFFWVILQSMSAYSTAILQEQLLGPFSAFLLFFHIASGGCILPIQCTPFIPATLVTYAGRYNGKLHASVWRDSKGLENRKNRGEFCELRVSQVQRRRQCDSEQDRIWRWAMASSRNSRVLKKGVFGNQVALAKWNQSVGPTIRQTFRDGEGYLVSAIRRFQTSGRRNRTKLKLMGRWEPMRIVRKSQK